MKVIQEAFVEGRETDVDWQESQAKKNELKMHVALENFSTMSKRERGGLIPLHKIDPETGDILETFPSRIAACRHIVKDILKRPERNPLGVSGNLEICMRSGWKAYGFYWKIADSSHAGEGVERPVYYWKNGVEIVFKSQSDAAAHFGVTKSKIRNIIKYPNKYRNILDGGLIEHKRKTPRIVRAATIKDAAASINCGLHQMIKILKKGVPVNNTTFIIDDSLRKVKERVQEQIIATQTKGIGLHGYSIDGFDLFDNKVKVGFYKDYSAIGRAIGEERQNVRKRILANKPLDKAGRFTAKVRYVKDKA